MPPHCDASLASILSMNTRVAQLEVRVADALASRQQAVGELQRFHVFVSSDVFEPFHAIARRILQLLRLDAALGLVGLQAGLHVLRIADMPYQRDCILHRQLGARSDRESAQCARHRR